MRQQGETAPAMTVPMVTPETAASTDRGEYRTASVDEFDLDTALDDGPVTIATVPGIYSQNCTEELCAISDRQPELAELPGQVYGLSVDTPWSQLAFIDEYDISYPLLSGFNSDILAELGTRREESVLRGIATRALFVIGPDRKIEYTWEAEESPVPDIDDLKDVVASV